MIWTLSKGPKKSYKYDLANSLVPLIVLLHDHQNHSKWPKWGHIRYTVNCRDPNKLKGILEIFFNGVVYNLKIIAEGSHGANLKGDGPSGSGKSNDRQA